jgi:hypothetical protein
VSRWREETSSGGRGTWDFASEDVTPAEIVNLLEPPHRLAFQEELPKGWGPGLLIETRNSPLLEQSNAATIVEFLRKCVPQYRDDWGVRQVPHAHFGWMKYLSFRVLDEQGMPTRVARTLKDIYRGLAECPVFDEDDLSQRELSALWKNIEKEGEGLTEADPEEWVERVIEWLRMHRPGATENVDGNGGWVEPEIIKHALEALKYRVIP